MARKSILIFIPALLLFTIGCAPGKKSESIYFDIYCDSCYVKIRNEWSEGTGSNKTHIIEIPFEGIVNDYKRVEFHRFDSPNNCVRPLDYVNYSTDTAWTWIYIIENNDTTAAIDNGGAGFCY